MLLDRRPEANQLQTSLTQHPQKKNNKKKKENKRKKRKGKLKILISSHLLNMCLLFPNYLNNR